MVKTVRPPSDFWPVSFLNMKQSFIFKHETRAILCHLFSPISLAFQWVTRKIWWWVSQRRPVIIYSDFLLNNMDENCLKLVVEDFTTVHYQSQPGVRNGGVVNFLIDVSRSNNAYFLNYTLLITVDQHGMYNYWQIPVYTVIVSFLWRL
jgi:hypothetical protein